MSVVSERIPLDHGTSSHARFAPRPMDSRSCCSCCACWCAPSHITRVASRLFENEVCAFTPWCTLGKLTLRVRPCDRDLTRKREASQATMTPRALCVSCSCGSPRLQLTQCVLTRIHLSTHVFMPAHQGREVLGQQRGYLPERPKVIVFPW